MSNVVVYAGPNRVDLNLRYGMIFATSDDIPDRIKAQIDSNSAFANFFIPIERFRQLPPPGSSAFARAKVAQEPPLGRTLIQPPQRRLGYSR